MSGSFGGLDAIATPQIIIVSLLVVFLVPLLLHFIAFRPKAVAVPTFMAVGPKDVGKTSLLTYLQNGTLSDTQTSTTPSAAIFTLKDASSSTPGDSDNEDNDTSATATTTTAPKRKAKLMDTPGHPKLRSPTFDYISETTKQLQGLIFLLDSAALQTPQSLNDTVTYLYDILLAVQKRCMASTGSVSAARGEGIPVLLACNKNDLFTALPAGKIGKLLEGELEKLRDTKGRGLQDAGKGEDGGEDEGGGDILGDDDGREFSWEMMADVGVNVTIKGGSIKMGKVQDWEAWFSECVN